MNPAYMPLYDNIIYVLAKNSSNINPQNVQTCGFKTFLMMYLLSDMLDGWLVVGYLSVQPDVSSVCTIIRHVNVRLLKEVILKIWFYLK